MTDKKNIDEIMDFLKSNTYEETQKKYNVTRGFLRRNWEQLYGKNRSYITKKIPPETVEKIVEFYETHTMAETMQHFGVSSPFISKVYRRYNGHGKVVKSKIQDRIPSKYGEIKRLKDFKVGEWFMYFNTPYCILSKTNEHIKCVSVDRKNLFWQKSSPMVYGANCQMKVLQLLN